MPFHEEPREPFEVERPSTPDYKRYVNHPDPAVPTAVQNAQVPEPEVQIVETEDGTVVKNASKELSLVTLEHLNWDSDHSFYVDDRSGHINGRHAVEEFTGISIEPGHEQEFIDTYKTVKPDNYVKPKTVVLARSEPSDTVVHQNQLPSVREDFFEYARAVVAVDYTDHQIKAGKLDFRAYPKDFYVVWFAKTLQNWKAMVSTDIAEGLYFEVTHSGSRSETYVDTYRKESNTAYPDQD